MVAVIVLIESRNPEGNAEEFPVAIKTVMVSPRASIGGGTDRQVSRNKTSAGIVSTGDVIFFNYYIFKTIL